MSYEKRADPVVRRAVRNNIVGVLPERRSEIEAYWKQYEPLFVLCPDTGEHGSLVMKAGMFRYVLFNPRVLRAFWLASFIAWEAYEQNAQKFREGEADFSRFEMMMDRFCRILTVEKSWAVDMPERVPEPGSFPDSTHSYEERLPAQLAALATSWAFLHEIRHVQTQQDGTSPRQDAPTEELHGDELSCDEFATTFILERVEDSPDAKGGRTG